MNTTVQKWGNSLGLRIPSSIAKDIRLRPGSAVELAVEDGTLMVKPAKSRKLSLAAMLKGVSKGNRHSEQDWGKRMGRESL